MPKTSKSLTPTTAFGGLSGSRVMMASRIRPLGDGTVTANFVPDGEIAMPPMKGVRMKSSAGGRAAGDSAAEPAIAHSIKPYCNHRYRRENSVYVIRRLRGYALHP